VTALKSVNEELIEINIALDGVTDLNSDSTFSITQYQPELRQPSDLDFPLPVLSLESVFITKLIAQRDKDVADLLAILLLQSARMDAQRFWQEADSTQLTAKLPQRLSELIEHIRSDEAMSIWYERTGLVLSDAEKETALSQLQQLRQARP
jgi:hypothetical protein